MNNTNIQNTALRNNFKNGRDSILYYYQYTTILGNIIITATKDAITSIHLGTLINPPGAELRTNLIDKAFQEIKEYLEGKRKTFDIPLAPNGTAFQQKVWNALLTIPYGETRTYSEIAEMIGNPKACRAVGMANNKNPIIIMIPCHRVIGKNGSLVGYACGLETKEYLLNLES
ncbi:MAG: methylated-DNA--[protein]-cysteine S-methyltransferase [Lachnospiraceae bacterium]|nr:methylated-DNA--[protein]-cysteine S-methyltransferase [Lachnospiraceae bacterium]